MNTNIVQHSLSQIQDLRDQGQDQTSADAPEAESLGTAFWKSARVVQPSGKTSTDSDRLPKRSSEGL
jgi:hypothetical protein